MTEYFAGDNAQAEAQGRWVRWDEIEPLYMIPGLGFQPVVGSGVMVNFVTFEPNTIAPLHWHDEEQVAIVIDGEMEFECAGEKRIVRRGEAVVVPPNVPHAARTYDAPCLAIDVFQPVRQGIADALEERGVNLGLEGRRALVTGGSKGLGYAIAEELIREGARVAICSRTEAEVLAAGEALGAAHAQAADVTDAESTRDFVARSAAVLGGIDCLVNNAGRAHPGNFATLTDEDWRADLDVKLFSLIRCSREVLPHMREGGGGRIVNIGAVYGRYPDPVFFGTSVIRAAGNSFTKTFALDVAKDNVLVNGVNIGFVVTPQWDNIHRRRAPDLARDEFFSRLAADEVPLGRFGEPEEVSGIVAFLLSERASYITGASIDVAGGMGKYV